MTVLTYPLAAVAIAVTVLVMAFGVRRPIGPRLPLLRTLAAGLIAFFAASPIITALRCTRSSATACW